MALTKISANLDFFSNPSNTPIKATLTGLEKYMIQNFVDIEGYAENMLLSQNLAITKNPQFLS